MTKPVDYKAMSAPDMLYECGSDAQKWADAFCQLNPDINVENDVMVGWFANAIMHNLDIAIGAVHNGEHAQHLLDTGRSPFGKEHDTR